LGCQIIYCLCNHTPGVCAERVYCPWVDAEQVMRDRGLPLFTWDTRQPAGTADIFAISLQYEMGFTNVLTLLDLAGIPLRATERHRPLPDPRLRQRSLSTAAAHSLCRGRARSHRHRNYARLSAALSLLPRRLYQTADRHSQRGSHRRNG